MESDEIRIEFLLETADKLQEMQNKAQTDGEREIINLMANIITSAVEYEP